MYKGKRIIAIIPARAGSVRIPGKNIKHLAGKPLIQYTLEQAEACEEIDAILVSSDSDEILRIASHYKCLLHKRPAELAQHDTPTIEVIEYEVKRLEQEKANYDIIMLLQPTSPFRSAGIIRKSIYTIVDENIDSVQTVSESDQQPYHMFAENDGKLEFVDEKSFRNKSQRKKFYIINGAVYAATRQTIAQQTLYGAKNRPIIMNKDESLDIDTMDDWKKAERLIIEKNMYASKELAIADKVISESSPIFIIAEAGVNHNGDINLAKKLIDAASTAKADAVKFQTFNALTGTSSSAKKVAYQKEGEEDISTYRDMLSKLQFPEAQWKELAQYAREKGILFMSTASDHESLEIVRRLNVPAYKIGSGHITNLPLLKETARDNKPIIMSVGMAKYEEIDDAVGIVKSMGNEKIVLLQCVSAYPTRPEDANVRMVSALKERYPFHIGYSDHTLGHEAIYAAVALGARVIEKHLTLDKNMPGPDHKASFEPAEFKDLIEKIRTIEKTLGDGVKKITQEEELLRKQVRRSVVAHAYIPKGTIITADMLRLKKPETGILPKYYWNVLGKKAARDIQEDTSLQWEDVDA